MKYISIIGAGNMGAALAVGFAAAGYEVKISNRTPAKLERLRALEGIAVCENNTSAIENADLVIFAVKACALEKVLAEVGGELNYNRTIVASLIPDYSLSQLEQMLKPYNKAPMIAKVMPNTAVSVGESMTFVSLNEYAAAYSNELREVFASVGEVEVIDESLFASATLLCSCGLAYAFRYIRAASEGGVNLGFEAVDARRYVCQTLRGAAEMLERHNLHPEAAVDSVTTPGGITITGLIAMEKAGFTSSVLAGLQRPKNQCDE